MTNVHTTVPAAVSESALVESLSDWVAQQLVELALSGPQLPSLKPLGGDAGFRHYFRVPAEPPLLAVYAPPATEDSRAFVAVATYLRDQGIHTPKILARDLERGFLLIEDFGDCLYSDVLDADNADRLYGEAMMALLRLQQCPVTTMPASADGDQPGFSSLPGDYSLPGSYSLPNYDPSRLREEMALFHQWFVPQLLGYDLSPAENAMLERLYRQLEGAAVQQPQVWVHRDFHSRNLMHREGMAPGVIDFQDAVRGPITYDLVSLLRDCYVRWPPEQVRHWALAYGNMAVEVGVMAPVSQDKFLHWFDWMGLQRHLKVLGIFARLWLRDGKAGYLQDLPLVMRYTLEVAEQYPQFVEFAQWFRATLLPLCECQGWYQPYELAGDCVVEDTMAKDTTAEDAMVEDTTIEGAVVADK